MIFVLFQNYVFFQFFLNEFGFRNIFKKNEFFEIFGFGFQEEKKQNFENLQFFVVFETGYKTLKRGVRSNKKR